MLWSLSEGTRVGERGVEEKMRALEVEAKQQVGKDGARPQGCCGKGRDEDSSGGCSGLAREPVCAFQCLVRQSELLCAFSQNSTVSYKAVIQVVWGSCGTALALLWQL